MNVRTIVHLSDLHFGRVDAALLEPLRRCVAALAPDLVVVSGDLTQRARAAQFRAARGFLDTLPKPQLVVPGNHDVPLYDVARRFLFPLARYRRYITDELEPAYVDDEIAVLGVNTARSLTFKRGRVNAAQAARLRERMCALPQETLKFVVTHHPFDVPAGADEKDVLGRAHMLVAALRGCAADVLLSGHLHTSYLGDTTTRYKASGRSMLIVQAGTATSTRSRGEANAFNVVQSEPAQLRVDQYAWDASAREFRPAQRERFARTAGGWTRGEAIRPARGSADPRA